MENNYYNKYITYKAKYLYLKNNLIQNGGSGNLLSPEEIDQLFDNRDGFGIDEIDENKYNNNYAVSTYGELTGEGLLKVIEMCRKLGMNDLEERNFVDLGSGTGRVVFNASIYFNQVYGVELSTKRHNIGNKILEENKNRLRNNIHLVNGDMYNLVNGDMYNLNCSEMDVVYISSLCFTDEMMESLKEKLGGKLKNGSLIFTSKEMNIDGNNNFIKLDNELNVKMTWSENSQLYIYKKV